MLPDEDRKLSGCLGIWFAVCATLGLVMSAVVIWAVIELVQWVISK